MKFLYALMLFIVFNCSGQKSVDKVFGNNDIEFKLDSVFINAYNDDKPIFDPPYIFYYYTLTNKSNTPLRVTLRRWEHENLNADKTFSIFKGDTLELFGGNFTPNVFTVDPHSSMGIDLNYDPKHLLDIYDTQHASYSSQQDFLEDVAINSLNNFLWGNQKIVSLPIDTSQVKFRNPNDHSIQEWK